MKQLCIDIGNTSVHYGLTEGREVFEAGHLPTAWLHEGNVAAVRAELEPLMRSAGSAAFCSVVPNANPGLEACLGAFGIPYFHLTHESCRGLTLAYPKPAEIGEDRIANALAAQEYFGVPAVVIDMGTAVTFDIVSSEGYEGGVISPGLAVMRTYLHEQTALLPELSEDALVGLHGGIGKSTVEAMQLGVSVGFSGMIDALLARVKTALADQGEMNPIVLSTGGATGLLTRDWLEKTEFVENLTLLGLAVGAKRAG